MIESPGLQWILEAVAREFGANQRCMIVRNGLFSFRWTQIFESCGILDVARTQVQPATPVEEGANPGYGPPKLETLKAQIAEFKPKVVFAPHVETSAGMIIPDAYIAELAAAVHAVGGILVLDCIASGCIWVDMKALGVDVLISAPQKGWSGPACMAMVALGQGALDRMGESEADPSGTFALSLRKWKGIMDTYLAGKHSYFTTPPTDAIFETGKAMQEAKDFGFAEIKAAQEDLGAKTRAMLAKHGMKSVAGEGFEAPGVVVAYAPKDTEGNPVSSMGGLFAGQGLQIAAGVPLKVDDRTSSQGPDFTTFRLGLFGIDKLYNIDRTVAILEAAVVNIQASL